MAIDFTLTPELEDLRTKVRASSTRWSSPPRRPSTPTTGSAYLTALLGMRKAAFEAGLWCPHMPEEWGGMGLSHVEMAMVQAEAAKTYYGPWVLNCQAPDEGNMHTLLHWATPEQAEKYLRPLCDGKAWSCFAMTEPEVAGSDPTLIQTRAYQDGDEWVINGHKWFISNAHRANFAILIARTEDDPDLPQAANSAFIVDIPSDGLDRGPPGRDHARLDRPLRDPHRGPAGPRRPDARRPRARATCSASPGSGPARLAHCMRWIAQAETALDMMVDRSLNRFSHGSILAEKQGVQWMIADSAMELYQAKLMVLHAAYKIDRGDDFKSEVSMAKHFVANALNRIIDRAIQVHGALGYSTDTPLAGMFQHARWARFADGADEIHQMRIAQRTIAAYKDFGTTKAATGDLPI